MCIPMTEQEKQQLWITAWRRAGPELERIRNEELRNLDDSAGLMLLGAGARGAEPQCGLVAFQAWMMRLRVLQLMKELEHRS